MRVFLGLVEIAGYYRNLQLGFRELGVTAHHVDLTDHSFRYRPEQPWLVRLYRYSAARSGITAAPVGHVERWIWIHSAILLVLFAWAALRHDVFVFGYNSSFFASLHPEFRRRFPRFRPYADLRLLRRWSKRVIVVYHGSDHRPAYQDGSVMAADRGRSIEECIRLTREAALTIREVERWATEIVALPCSAQLHSRRRIAMSLAMGVPMPKPQRLPPVRVSTVSQRVRILHSPSHPVAKGTPAIREAVERLRSRGHDIDYVEVTGHPNAVVLAELARCDIAVDQLYSDTPMAGFAAEAALFAKPAVVGGYARETLERWLTTDQFPPTAYCRPDALEETLERLIADHAYRRELGESAARFVEREWSPQAVAGRFVLLANGRAPEAWFFDPHELTYVSGGGLSDERARQLVREVIECGGVQALQLDDKPELARRYAAFAGMESALVTAAAAQVARGS